MSFAVSATGASPLNYQWHLNDNAITGATSATFTIASVNSLNTGTYHVIVRNAQGQATSQRATLTLGLSAPSIVGQPQGGSIPIGGSTLLTAVAIGADLRYQWHLNDTPILGATRSTYQIDRAQTWMTGAYKVRVTNAGGVITSNPASVIIGSTNITDEFSGTNIDSNLWTTALPFSDSRTDLANGSLTLRNRGRVLSKTALPTAFNITTRFRLVGSSYDQYAIFFRMNGGTGSGSFNSGVGAYFQIRSGDQGPTGVNNIKIAQNDGDVTGSFPIALNTWYDASVDDNGSQVVIKINGTEVVRRNTSTRTGNLIGIQNREGTGGGSSISAGSAVEVDYVRITSPATASDAILPAPRLANISTRGFVGTGAEAIVIGFVTSGSRSQRLLVRAAGPALSDFGIQGALNDPLLKIFASGGVTIATNDNWSSADGPVAQTVGAFAFASGSRDAALSAPFTPGAYTIEITGANDATGTALVEAYDLDSSDEQVRLVNISTRGKVTGSEPLIAGLVVSGTTPRRVLIRGIGPTLASFGLGAALADPVLTVFDPHGNMLIENDDWGTQETASAVQAASSKAGAFALASNSKDAAVLAYLPPAAYTFVVNTKTGSPGIALIEVYDLD